MDCKKEKQLSITLKDTEIDNFKNIIDKCKDENKSIGFKNKKFSKEENDLLKNINEVINKD